MMQNPGLKVFVASALGAFIGSLVGLQLTPMFWWAGMLVGGLVGYIAFDARAAVRSIPVAYYQTRVILAKLCVELINEGRQLGKVMMIILTVVASLIGLGLSWTVPCTILSNINENHRLSFNSFANWFMDGSQSVVPVLLGAALWNLVIGMLIMVVALFVVNGIDGKGSDPSGRQLRRAALLYSNPTAFICYWLPKGLWFIGTFATMFGWELFKLVHSDRRLLCGIDAAIGAAAGISFHNPILGAFVGGLIGITDYEIITKRWLKLASN